MTHDQIQAAITAHEKNQNAPNDDATVKAVNDFLGVTYAAGATFHYAHTTGGVKYHEPGKDPYWTDLANFLRLREQGVIVFVTKHDHYDPVLGEPGSVYKYKS